MAKKIYAKDTEEIIWNPTNKSRGFGEHSEYKLIQIIIYNVLDTESD